MIVKQGELTSIEILKEVQALLIKDEKAGVLNCSIVYSFYSTHSLIMKNLLSKLQLNALQQHPKTKFQIFIDNNINWNYYRVSYFYKSENFKKIVITIIRQK